MSVFWKSSSARSGRPAGRPDAVTPWVDAGELQPGDWAAIEGLLESDTDGAAEAADPQATDPQAAASRTAGAPGAEPGAAVLEALTSLRALVHDPVLAAGPISDRLLDIWDLANQVRPEAAVPAASLMTALVHRDLVSADEVSATCAEIEELLTASA